MGMTEIIAKLAVRAVRVLIVEVPGQWLTRAELEHEMLQRGWRRAWAPADADVLAICGTPGPELAPLVDRVWEQMPGPRVRTDMSSSRTVSSALDDAATLYVDSAHHSMDARERAQEPQIPHDNMDHSSHGGMDHSEHGSHDHSGMDDSGHDHMRHSGHGEIDYSGADYMDHGDHDHMDHSGNDGMDHDEVDHDSHADTHHNGHDDHSGHGGMDHSEHGSHDHSSMEDSGHDHMGHSGHDDMDHDNHAGIDHSGHGGHGGHGEIDHSGADHVDGHDGMDHGDMDHSGHGGMDHSGHGGMDMSPGGIPLAQGGPDRDGLEMDVLHLPLGPVLPYWPPGLVLNCTLQGDVIVDSQASIVDDSDPEHSSHESAPGLRLALLCDNVMALLALAGADDLAARARRARDCLLRGDYAAADDGLKRLIRRVRRSWVLRWSLQGVLVLDEIDLHRHSLPASCRGDAYDRMLRTLTQIQALADGAGPLTDDDVVPWQILPRLVTGQELATLRLAVASMNLHPRPATQGGGA